MGRRENEYQAALKKRIEFRLPGCIILKNDEQLKPGIFDLTVLYGNRYAALEVKRERNAAKQPNQDYYLEEVAHMGGFAAFIYPENEEEVLDALQYAFKDCR